MALKKEDPQEIIDSYGDPPGMPLGTIIETQGRPRIIKQRPQPVRKVEYKPDVLEAFSRQWWKTSIEIVDEICAEKFKESPPGIIYYTMLADTYKNISMPAHTILIVLGYGRTKQGDDAQLKEEAKALLESEKVRRTGAFQRKRYKTGVLI